MEPTINWKRLIPLVVIVCVYLCVGAVIFKKIEGQPELDRRTHLTKMIKAFVDNHSCVDREDLYAFLQAVGTDTEFTLGALQNKSVSTRWDFTGAFSFVVTVVTTIGYGNLAPHTEIGKLTLMGYALIGIPLTLLMLQGLGQHLMLLSKKVNKLKLCSKRPEVNKYLNMALIILLGITMLFLGPTFLFMYVENWTWMESLYYCFVTLSTIGFGDYIAALSENRFSGREAGTVYRIVAYVWILFGLAYLALVISYISDVLMKKAEEVEKISKTKLETEARRLKKEMSKRTEQIFSVAESVADTVVRTTGLEIKRRQPSKDPDAEVAEQSTNQETPKPPEVKVTPTIHKGIRLIGYRPVYEDDSVRL